MHHIQFGKNWWIRRWQQSIALGSEGWYLCTITGTMENPIMVKSAGDEQYAGCTGCPADSHVVNWLTVRFTSMNPHLPRPSLTPLFPNRSRLSRAVSSNASCLSSERSSSENATNRIFLPCLIDVAQPPHRTLHRVRKCVQDGIHWSTGWSARSSWTWVHASQLISLRVLVLRCELACSCRKWEANIEMTDHHDDGVHSYEGEPKTFADYIKPEYLYR